MTRPESAGLSGPRLQHIDRFLQQKYLDTGKLPCALTLIERNGQIAHCSALGRMDVERNRPLQEDTIFRIYSMTKPLTSIALMMLVEEGSIALDDPVHRYIPQWRDLGVYEGGFIGSFRTRRTSAPMRIIDLLRHTSGLTYGFQQRTNVDAAYRKLSLGELPGAVPLERMIEELAKVPLEFSPGTAFNYSVSTDVVGYLVGKVAGQPFEQFLRTRIIEPLGMVDTDFMVPAAKAARFAACYAATPDGRMTLQDDPETSGFLKPPGFVSGGGGLVSTATDYMRFCQMLLNGGELDGRRLLSPLTVQLMRSNVLPVSARTLSPGTGFGMDFAVVEDPVAAGGYGGEGTFYWGGYAGTWFWIDPVYKLIVVGMIQQRGDGMPDVRALSRSLTYQAIVK